MCLNTLRFVSGIKEYLSNVDKVPEKKIRMELEPATF